MCVVEYTPVLLLFFFLYFDECCIIVIFKDLFPVFQRMFSGEKREKSKRNVIELYAPMARLKDDLIELPSPYNVLDKK
jgi:hypothetical protein